MSFVLVTLRFFHGGKISMDKLHSFSVEDYVGGMITDCVDVDVDMFSYFEFLGYVKEFGYNSSSAVIYVRPPNCPGLVVIKVDRDLMGICEELKSGDILEVYVDHLVEEAVVVPPLLEYVSQVVDDSNVTFEKESGQDLGGCEGLGTSEKASNTAENSANNSVPTAVTTDDSSNSSSESNSSESSSNTDNSSDSEHEELFEEGEADYGSDTHEEYRAFRAERRTVERRKRKESAPEQEHVKLGKRGPDVGYDEYESRKKKSLEGKIGGDEPYYHLDEATSFETDPDDVDDEGEGEVQQKVKARKRKTKRRVIFDKTCKKIVWETGLAFASVRDFREVVTKYVVQQKVSIEKYVNEPTRVRVKCKKASCPWLLVASYDSRTKDFVVKNYNPVHKCDPTNRNKLCNSKFLAKRFNERIKEQPNIRIFKFQELIRKKLGLYVGRTVCRRAKNIVLNEIMGDYKLEYGRI